MTALTAYGIELEVALGVGRSADAGVWDTGLWDAAVWAQSDTALGDWVDITCSVQDGLRLAAGTSDADGVVTRWEAASCSFTALSSVFDPWSGPYAGLLGPMLPVRVRWRSFTAALDEALAPLADPDGWLIAFQGFVTDDGYNYTPDPDPRRSAAAITAVDATTILATFDGVEQTPQGSGETASARVGRILDTALWPPGDRDITAGGQPVKETTLADVAWTMLLQVADSDLALMWVRRDGRLAYRPDGRVGSGVALAGRLAICPAGPDDVQVVTMGRAQPNVTRNIVSISRQVNDGAPEAATVTLIDEASAARFRAHSYARTDLIHMSDAWSTTIAQVVLGSSAWPSDAPRNASLSSRLGDPRVPALLLSVEPEHVFTVTDGRREWTQQAVGWDVNVALDRITGTINLDDITRWTGSAWDSPAAGWDYARWGV